jgi:4-hydroxyphenylacetate 3-monooxygenase
MFAVPNHLPGIRFICRESHVLGSSTFDYPLSSRFEEMDTMVIFDRVPVPADRIFLYGNEALASRYVAESHFHTHVSHHILCRYIAKTELFLGTASHLGQALGLEANSSYVEKMSIIITALETLKALLLTAEWKARRDKWGSMLPDVKPLLTANVYFPSVYPSMVEIIQLLGSSGIMMIPSKGDLDSAIGADLGKYLKGEDRNAAGYVALCRLAWELSASSFGGRQLQYERFFFGNPQRVRDRLYNGYKEIEEDCRRKVTRFLNGSLL